MAVVTVDIGVFAHDEAQGIAAMVAELARQDILLHPGIDARILILANGCTDATVERASAACAALGARIEVVELAEGGKSRTWNAFVHILSRPGAQVLVFCDADIEMPAADSLSRLVAGLLARPGLRVFNSRPVKDITYRPEGLGVLDRMIAMAGGTLNDWRTAICGQLYAMPAAQARNLHLPIGLPVEDGFLRAMVLTDALTLPEDLTRIDGDPELIHLYASERGILPLIRHQTRIVIGSALNEACFAHLRQIPAQDRRVELAQSAQDEDWLAQIARAGLPRAPFGYVPLHFLTKRVINLSRSSRDLLHPRRLFVLFAGFCFDFIVYINAQIRMARGVGSGHW
ncbi:MAG: glycosyltransferase [Paracoccaceae bacterium]|nr:glycosyltransferase [Paracoccaceae bacterium]